MCSDDTITAVATASGKAAIAVVRISGKTAKAILESITGKNIKLEPRIARLVTIKSETSIIDSVLVSWFPRPHSFTGEDTVEISCHGNPYLTGKLLDMILARGARMAKPGEFTMRAFQNGKIDLAQAEAVNDMINACSYRQLESAAYQLKGGLSEKINSLRQKIIELMSSLESQIDFAEEDIYVGNILDCSKQITADLTDLTDSYSMGRIIREGVAVVLAGAPNVGKSTLFNALIDSDRAIVTDQPGTTRDVLRESIEIEGIPLTFLDTAGIRDSENAVEAEGVKRSKNMIFHSDMVLVVLDGSRKLTAEDKTVLRETEKRRRIIVINKSDLDRSIDFKNDRNDKVFCLSALSASEVKELALNIVCEITGTDFPEEKCIITNRRHYDSLMKAVKAMEKVSSNIENNYSAEYIAEDLKEAVTKLSEITGLISADDVLNHIFSNFCVGK